MATRRETADYILEQLEPLNVRVHPMFGEFCLYCDEKPVAFICDETFYLEPTTASDGRGFTEAEAYSGSRPYRVLDGDIIEDSDEFRALVKATARVLPAPLPRRSRAGRLGGSR